MLILIDTTIISINKLRQYVLELTWILIFVKESQSSRVLEKQTMLKILKINWILLHAIEVN